MIHGRRTWVVVPAFEEARLIGTMLASLPQNLAGVIVVDDASTDGTADIVASLIEQQRISPKPAVAPPISLIRHPTNAGVGAAITTGYREFLAREEAGNAVCVVMGGDNQMDPNDLPALVAAIVSGADYAKGNRFAGDEARCNMPRVRWCGNVALTVLTRWATGCWRVTDSQCGYAAITRAALLRLPLAELYARYGFPNDLLLHAAERRMSVVDVPVRAVYADEQSKIRLPKVAPRIFWMLAKGWVRRHMRSGVHGIVVLLLAAAVVPLACCAVPEDAAPLGVLPALAALLLAVLLDAFRECRVPCASSH